MRAYLLRTAPLLLILAVLFLSSCADTKHRLLVSIEDQRLAVFREGTPIATFPVSTSKFGLGDVPNSNFTPLGKMQIAKKIGDGQPVGMKFKSRVPTGEIVPVNSPGRDPIVTRILWLKGMEPQNKGAYKRYIYIHGTPEESKLGTPASYGCVRMASKDIVWLYDTIGTKVRVDIIPGKLPVPPQLPR